MRRRWREELNLLHSYYIHRGGEIAPDASTDVYCPSVRYSVRQPRSCFSNAFVGLGEEIFRASESTMTMVIAGKRQPNEFLTNLEFPEGQRFEALTRHFHPI